MSNVIIRFLEYLITVEILVSVIFEYIELYIF